MINFAGLGYDAAERVGLIPALRAVQPAPMELVYVDGRGRPRARMDTRTQQGMLGSRVLALFRGDLEQVLFEALDDAVQFRFGATVESISQHDGGVTARLSNGQTETVDLLVGADGLHLPGAGIDVRPGSRLRSYDLHLFRW